MIGRIVGGSLEKVYVRQAPNVRIEVGDLLVWEGEGRRHIMQITSLEHGSQVDRRTHEMIAGLSMSGQPEIYEPDMADYVLAGAKPLAIIEGNRHSKPKDMTPVFGDVRLATSCDMSFLPGPANNRVMVGYIRSGSKVVGSAALYMDATEMFSHHILVPAATGRGKSNLIKCMLYGLMDTGKVGALVLDAHGEYGSALSRHPNAAAKLAKYDSYNMEINVRSVTPYHFRGVVEFSEAQDRMIWDLYGSHKKEWIIHLLDRTKDEDIPDKQKITRHVLRQKVKNVLGIPRGRTFVTDTNGQETIHSMVSAVANGCVVIIDTSNLGTTIEMMTGSMVASRLLWQYRQFSENGTLSQKPVATVIMEEAPRLLGTGGLGEGNPFAAIAREGRKFKVGVCAITQMASAIPRDIMTNLNTKIILGNEMRAERDHIVGSSAQDLTDDYSAIAALNPGEAIVSSIFVPFAIPVRIPLYDELAGGRPRVTVY